MLFRSAEIIVDKSSNEPLRCVAERGGELQFDAWRIEEESCADKSSNEPLRCVAFRRVALRGIVTLCGDKLTNEPLRFLSICCDATRSGAPRRHADRVAGKSFNEPLR